ncbi:hypothetical protein [Bradyrhizobium sp.]|uniref:hypothetical protein n=1 Tax=Bradyrhizobium sp. TaxID=376 RepID=UPI0039E3EC9E
MTGVGHIALGECSLAAVFGLPGPATAAVVEVLQAITRVACRDSVVVEVNSPEDWDAACGARQPFIALSQYPLPDLLRHPEFSLVPVICVASDPLRSVAHLLGDRLSDVGAVRSVSASLSCLLGRWPRDELDLQAQNARNLSLFLTRLAQLGGVNVRLSDIERIELQAGELAERLADICGEQQTAPLPANSLWTLAAAALPQLRDPHRGLVEATWLGPLFLLGDFPDTWMRGPVDLSGPARCVLYGPYLHLPPGHWRTRLVVGLAGHDGREPFTVEIVCGEVIARGTFCAEGSGLFEVEMEFVHRDPHVPIELRLFLDVGAIYGWLSRFEISLELREGYEVSETVSSPA